MFFVRGLSSKGKEVFVNPDQVLFVRPAGLLRSKTALVLTHNKRLVVSNVGESEDDEVATAEESIKQAQRSDLS